MFSSTSIDVGLCIHTSRPSIAPTQFPKPIRDFLLNPAATLLCPSCVEGNFISNEGVAFTASTTYHTLFMTSVVLLTPWVWPISFGSPPQKYRRAIARRVGIVISPFGVLPLFRFRWWIGKFGRRISYSLQKEFCVILYIRRNPWSDSSKKRSSAGLLLRLIVFEPFGRPRLCLFLLVLLKKRWTNEGIRDAVATAIVFLLSLMVWHLSIDEHLILQCRWEIVRSSITKCKIWKESQECWFVHIIDLEFIQFNGFDDRYRWSKKRVF